MNNEINENEFRAFSSIIENAFCAIEKNFGNLNLKKEMGIFSIWEEILFSIKAENPETGKNLAAHTHIIDLKNGILLVEVDHPAWLSLLQFYKNYILRGLKKKATNLKINSLAFRISGQKAELTEAQKIQEFQKERQKIIQKLNSDQKTLQNQGYLKTQKSKSKKSIPEPLKEIFLQMKNNLKN